MHTVYNLSFKGGKGGGRELTCWVTIETEVNKNAFLFLASNR